MIRWLHYKRGLAWGVATGGEYHTHVVKYDKRPGVVRRESKSVFIDIDPRWYDCADYDDLVTIHFKPYHRRGQTADLFKPFGIDRGGRTKPAVASDLSWIAGRSFPEAFPFVSRERLLRWLDGQCQSCESYVLFQSH